jgi:ribosomal protein S18 acetylase RimI-like enzyme
MPTAASSRRPRGCSTGGFATTSEPQAPAARAATEADVDAICRVCAAGWRDTYRETHTSADIEATIAEFYVPDRVRAEIEPGPGWWGWVVAEADGRVAGAGGGGPAEPGACELYVLYVDPPFQSRGLGSAVLAAVTEQARAHGAATQRVAVAPDNPKGIGFYRRHGFAAVGRRPGYPAARAALESLVMERGIGA